MKVSVCLVSEIFEGAGNFRDFFVSDEFSDGRFGFSTKSCLKMVVSDLGSVRFSFSAVFGSDSACKYVSEP